MFYSVYYYSLHIFFFILPVRRLMWKFVEDDWVERRGSGGSSNVNRSSAAAPDAETSSRVRPETLASSQTTGNFVPAGFRESSSSAQPILAPSRQAPSRPPDGSVSNREHWVTVVGVEADMILDVRDYLDIHFGRTLAHRSPLSAFGAVGGAGSVSNRRHAVCSHTHVRFESYTAAAAAVGAGVIRMQVTRGDASRFARALSMPPSACAMAAPSSSHDPFGSVHKDRVRACSEDAAAFVTLVECGVSWCTEQLPSLSSTHTAAGVHAGASSTRTNHVWCGPVRHLPHNRSVLSLYYTSHAGANVWYALLRTVVMMFATVLAFVAHVVGIASPTQAGCAAGGDAVCGEDGESRGIGADDGIHINAKVPYSAVSSSHGLSSSSLSEWLHRVVPWAPHTEDVDLLWWCWLQCKQASPQRTLARLRARLLRARDCEDFVVWPAREESGSWVSGQPAHMCAPRHEEEWVTTGGVGESARYERVGATQPLLYPTHVSYPPCLHDAIHIQLVWRPTRWFMRYDAVSMLAGLMIVCYLLLSLIPRYE